MKTFIISDTHWNHDFLVERKIRPIDYQSRIIKGWRRVVNKDDIVIHLGDVIFSRPSELADIMKQLPGIKILVRGNHDKQNDGWYIRKGFSFVCDSFVSNGVLFSHEPMRMPDGVSVNIHGHFHAATGNGTKDRKYRDFYSDKHMVLSLERDGYEPKEVGEFVSDNLLKLL